MARPEIVVHKIADNNPLGMLQLEIMRLQMEMCVSLVTCYKIVSAFELIPQQQPFFNLVSLLARCQTSYILYSSSSQSGVFYFFAASRRKCAADKKNVMWWSYREGGG